MGVRIARLKRRSEFLRVARAGRKWATPGLVLQAAERCGTADGEFRVGFTASRKVGSAVVRNRVRRRLRAAVDEVMPSRARAGHDYVVIARRGALRRPFADLLGDLRAALDRVAAKGGARGRRREATRG